jgi:methyl coenzyme M reductase beta subunit
MIAVGLIIGVLGVGTAQALVTPENMYDVNMIHTFYIQMDATDYQDMRFSAGDNYGEGPGLVFPDPVTGQYEWWQAYLGQSPTDPNIIPVAIRRKSAPALPSEADPQKFSIKVDIHKPPYTPPGQRFGGKKKLSLECGSAGSLVSEGLAWYIYNAAGVVSCYSNWVKVYMSTDLGQNWTYMGLYINLEQIDNEFLEDHMPNRHDYGFLYQRTETIGEIKETRETESNPFEFSWYPFDHPTYMSETIPPPTDWLTQTPQRVDMNQLMKFAVLENFVYNQDGTINKGNNYYYYDWATNPTDPNLMDPNYKQPRMYFPWDLDTCMIGSATGPLIDDRNGNFVESLIKEEQENGTPYGYHTYQEDYYTTYRSLLDGPLATANMQALITTIQNAIGAEINADPLSEVTSPTEFDRLRTYVANRWTYIDAQLDAMLPLPGTSLLNDGFEGAPWNTNWNNVASTWTDETVIVHSGSHAAGADRGGGTGYFTSDALDASDATAIYIRFYFQKKSAATFTVEFYGSGGWSTPINLIPLGGDNEWLVYTNTITNSSYFVSDFKIRFNAAFSGGGTRSVEVDDVEITKTLPAVQYTITASSGANGYVDPNGAVVKDQGSSQLFTASANTGYEVDQWLLDSSPVQTGGTTYTLTNITANHTVNVTFKLSGVTQYTITASSGANGYIDPNGAVVKNQGENQLFTASANTGYEVDTWYMDSSPVQTGGTTYTITNIQANHTLNVTFKQLQYTITASSGANGYVDPNGAVIKNYGSSQLFTASANTGYEVDQWLLDSSPVQTGGTTYNLTNITANHTLNVTFKQLQYTITASYGANGTVDPNGAIVKNYGEDQLFTASANTGYEVDQWLLDSSPVQTGGTTYNLTNITANHTLNVTFKQLQYTVTASYGANGSVDPNGAIVKNYGESQLFTASANTGYEVDTWYLDSSPVQTGGTTYNLTNITANHTLNVTFKQLQYTITASYGANGTVDPNGAIVKNYGEDQLFTASANTGYEVDQWLLDSSPVQTGGVTYNLTNITANHTLSVTFKQLQYTVTASYGANGTVDPNGAIVKNYGEDQLFTASANTGYEVDQWLLDSSPVQTGGTTYNLTNITANHTLNVTFKQLQYTVTAGSGANGSVDPNGAIVKNYGEDQLFTASANTGYEVDQWLLDSSPVQTGGTTYNLTNITANHTLNVTFKQLQYTVTASYGANGTVDPNGAVVKNYGEDQLFTASANTGYEVDQWLLDSSPVQTGGTTYNLTNITANHTLSVTFKQLQYTVTASYGANGTVDPNGAIVKNYGEDQLFTASANTGYEVDQWLLDSSPVQTGGTTYNLTNIIANHTLNVTFKQLQYTITASYGANGTVDPNGAVVKNYGEDQLFTASANTGYEVDQWLLDSSPVQTGGTTYNLTNITANHTLSVTFKQLQYTITASYGANGSVDPNGAVVKNYGEDQLFTASANTGYEVDQWLLDSSPVQTGGTTYNLTNITANHTLNVTFKQLQYTVTASYGANGYVDPNGAVIKNYGSSQLFTASANTGYEVDQWLLDSSPVQTGGTTYNLTNITANHTLNVTFKQLQYTITASYGANGTVDPNGAIVKNYGEDQLFTASANTGYEVDQWLLDSSPVQTGGTTYNLTNITANHTLNVTFKQLQYTVTASSGANGYVDPNGAIVKNYGEDQLFTASANTGYEVDQWLLDSSPVQTGGTTYNLTNITANHTLNVTFKQLQYTITASYGANGTVDPNGAIVKNYGEDQLFTASANIGYMVDTWYLDGNNVQLGGTTYTLTNIQSAHTVNVTFTILPADNFDDNTQSALWQTYEDSANNTWLRDFEEANQRLQLQAISQITSYKAYLLGHYKMNDNDANTRVLDSSGNGKDGVAARNTSLLHTTGQIDGALTFNGTADSIRTNIVMGGAYTKVAWIKRGPDIIGEYNSIISSDTSAHTLWAPRYRGYKLSAGHNTNRTIVEDPAAITAGVWYFVAVTFDPLLDSGRMVLYKNGAPVSTATSVATPVASSNTFIGKWGGSYLFNGAIDNVMLFNRALTADEIATIYNGGAGTETLPDDIYLESETMATSTVGHWKLNDNDANTRVLDASGNGNNGTAQQNTSVLHTTGKLDGALAFDGATDYINLGSVVGTGAYTKVAWVKRDAGDYYNSILSSDNSSHVLWAPYDQSFKLSAGHNASGYLVQDTASLNPDLWYCVAVTYNPAVHSGLMVLYKDGVQVDSATSVAAQAASTATCVGRYGAGSYFKGAVDNVMVFDRALTAQEIAILYNGGSGTETIPSDHFYAAYLANGWQFDVSEDFQVKIDVHYSALSSNDGWMGITIEKAGDPDNYVSLSAGTAANQPYFFYEKLVDGSPVTAQQARASNDGALYVSYDSALDQLYVSSTGYGSANAWQTVSGLLQGQWASESLALYIGGGSDRSLILPGQAYLDNLVIDQAALLNWPILADLNGDGFIDFLDVKEFADNWLLSTGPDLNDDGIVDFFDFTLFNQGW